MCLIREKTKQCNTTINLEGECYYKSRNRDCKYIIAIVSERGQDVAYVKFKDQPEEKLEAGGRASGCAEFEFQGQSRLVVKEKKCDCKEGENPE